MRGLIEKDIRLLSHRSKFLIMVFGITALLLFAGNDPTFIIGYVTILTAIFALSTLSYDEQDHCMEFLMTLPVDAKAYVGGKFLLSASFGMIGWLYCLCLLGAYSMFKGGIDWVEGMPTYISYVCVFFIVIAITIPLQLKFGGESLRVAMGVIFGIIIVISVVAFKFVATDATSSQVTDKFTTSDGLIMAGLFLSVAIVVAISYFISVRILQKKEY